MNKIIFVALISSVFVNNLGRISGQRIFNDRRLIKKFCSKDSSDSSSLMTSVAPCVMKASDELRTIVTGCLSGDASNMLSKLCNSESRAEMTKCMGTGFSKITDRSARQAIKGSIKDITACLQNVNTGSS